MADSFANLKAAFVAVQGLSVAERAAWLSELSDRDPPLHAAVQSFLAFEARASAPMNLHGLEGEGPSPAPLLGTRYEDHRLLGTGGIGEVREVHDPLLNRRVALKFLQTQHHTHPDDAHRQRMAERFVAEAQIQASLQHPNIVPVYERGELPDGRPYLTMAVIEGQTLARAIDHAEGWTLRRLVTAFEQICRAMVFAHTRGILHRDLKPSNVMLGTSGETWVLDWGLARMVQQDPSSLAGTPAYLAPERLLGASAEPRTDVYALGAILYAILAGRDPYVATHPGAVLDQVRRGPPAALPPNTPPALAALCEAAMAREPAERLEEAAHLADQTRAWLDGELLRTEALELIARADRQDADQRVQLAEAHQLAAEADEALATLPPWADESTKAPHWEKADRAAALRQAASLLEARRLQTLASALERVPTLEEAHHRLADHHAARHREAEAARDATGAAQEAVRIQEHDSAGRYAAYLEGIGALSLVTDPPGAEVLLHRYVLQNRRLVPQFEASLGTTPLVAHPLAMGSYLCILRKPGFDDVRYPVSISRQAHWDGIRPGTKTPLPIRLFESGTLGADELYVPAGWFQSGGDPATIFAHPPRRLWCDALIIQQHSVTTEAYLEFLDDLVAQGREEEARTLAPLGVRTGDGLSETDQPDRLVERDERGRFVPTVSPNGHNLILRGPVTMLVWPCAVAYAAWLAAKTGHPWRPPLELEWEKAARGVDGRLLPWGDHQDPSWSNMRTSRPTSRTGSTFFADVDAFPVDRSVYGMRHVVGNVRNWCLEDRGSTDQVEPPDLARLAVGTERRVGRGASWGSRKWEARLCSRPPLDDDTRNPFLGIRLVRRP
ncbi:MAG: bifunctional serine/threonine-protein kinase/formylglycine-generating enzyme family protein [Myxococcota bacterium]